MIIAEVVSTSKIGLQIEFKFALRFSKLNISHDLLEFLPTFY